MTTKFDFSLLSRFRAELMGISILGIMLAHISGWMEIRSSVWIKFVDVFSRLSHTEGFLLLSGLGLYYSFSKDITPPHLLNNANNKYALKDFYWRRFWRLVVPFAIMSLPFYMWSDLIQHPNIGRFLLDWSSLYFWFYGNNGMWYISVSIVFYALFPFIYRLVGDSFRNLLALLLAILVLLAVLRYAFPTYYEMTVLGIPKITAFVVGCYCGYLAKDAKSVKAYAYWGILLLLLLPLFAGKRWDGLYFTSFYELTLRLITIPLCCVWLLWISKVPKLLFVGIAFRWLGKYSLELYVLHMFLYGVIFDCFKGLPLMINGLLLFAISLAVCQPVHILIDKVIGLIRKS